MRVVPLGSQPSVAPVDAFIPQADQWVQLRDRLSEYSDDQALLLCEATDDRWVAWIPNHGEALLERDQFLKS
ncbi:MAG: hypothetical protein KME43_15590 [Myxacorys chilensis ATA2-1-KO14]|nr:hypothetical protein [Myxacorys chilensis ATA2-1-KO14]